MILNNFPHILWINLEKSEERRNKIIDLLNQYQLKNTRIIAIDGSNEIELNSKCIINSNLTCYENACSTSHLTAMKYFIDNISDEEIIIFEDDVSFEFLEYIPFNWDEFYNKLPVNYKIIQLSVTRVTGIVNPILIKTHTNMNYYSATAYLIKKSIAIEIVNKFYSFEENKFNLSNEFYKTSTADGIISNTNYTYTIPIFTYQTTDSTIHQSHLGFQNNSKLQQLNLWKRLKKTKFDHEKYFSLFPK